MGRKEEEMKLVTEVSAIERAIGIDSSEWPGKCHAIAILCVKKGLVPKGSKAVYGLWHGEIADDSLFAGRPFTHHGWVQLPDGRIYDPTRFAFLGCGPAVWVGQNKGEYDAGGNAYRKVNEKPRPPQKGKQLKVTKEQRKVLRRFVNDDKVYISDCFWLANLSLDTLDESAVDVYSVLEELGCSGFIPVDNINLSGFKPKE